MFRVLLQIIFPDITLYPSHVKTTDGKLTITRFTEEPSRGLRLSEDDIEALIKGFFTNPVVINKTDDRIIIKADYNFIALREEKKTH